MIDKHSMPIQGKTSEYFTKKLIQSDIHNIKQIQ